jgi:hypothetical protein
MKRWVLRSENLSGKDCRVKRWIGIGEIHQSNDAGKECIE